jgi:hypothetical protein
MIHNNIEEFDIPKNTNINLNEDFDILNTEHRSVLHDQYDEDAEVEYYVRAYYTRLRNNKRLRSIPER